MKRLMVLEIGLPRLEKLTCAVRETGVSRGPQLWAPFISYCIMWLSPYTQGLYIVYTHIVYSVHIYSYTYIAYTLRNMFIFALESNGILFGSKKLRRSSTLSCFIPKLKENNFSRICIVFCFVFFLLFFVLYCFCFVLLGSQINRLVGRQLCVCHITLHLKLEFLLR